ncbi:ER membrane complex subunit EMC3 KNAG_0G00210 [Huiozyma naganishii CBS 8797]|uniref:ER membrane protein complex subunit 3 n=1 Tax=Huiozyma naganishii (strain ATCC MYA-139 / BCRC 22969 / CBS 8797 / KCTC 17520 / NBRC 10181 / NCYC 3082 / Yp74L-3) TaxID=1071383 RepID=J7S7P2_HUIN7|nr:hypothetical protein KNAG_0G00210 [Kazachstania naganishii CBS 8797]CCK71079.1 hypothetical protein KNAG_0G00210 [Kazachstania naganishii CBS 8797]
MDTVSWFRTALVGNVTSQPVKELMLDPQLKYWVLLPISIVMILTGILRQYVTTLISPGVKGYPVVKITESQYVSLGSVLIGNGSNLTKESFDARRDQLSKVLLEGKYVAQTNTKEGEIVNPFSDPNISDAISNMAKGNMANFIPQTIIMWWVNHFFSGFVLMKLPFPLTVRFKEMLQNGISTSDLDVRWVSSISWYFISVLGLNPVYNLLLKNQSSVDLVQQQQSASMPQSQPVILGGAGQPKPEDVMKSVANDLIIAQHESCFDGIEARVLKLYS